MQRYLSLDFYKTKWKHAGFQRYFRNISWMFWSRMATMGISFLATLYIARTLGPSNFGELDYAVAVVAMFSWIGSWGVETVLSRELIKHPEQKNEIMGTGFVLRFMFGVFATIITIIFAFISPVDTISRTLILLLAFTNIASIPSLLQTDFVARAESKYPSLVTVLVVIIINIAKVIVLLLGKGVIYLAAITVLEQLLYASFYIMIYKTKARGVFSEWRFSKKISKIIIKSGTAVAFLALFSMIYARIDQIMIRHLLGAGQVGLYGAGVRLVEVWGFIPGIIFVALYPAVLNAKKISDTLYYQRLRQVLFLLLLSSFSATLILVTMGSSLMSIIYGHAFSGGIASLKIYALSIPFTFLGYFVIQILYTDDYRKILVITTLVPAIVNVVLNVILIPKFGIIGASYATLISYSATPLTPLLFNKTRSLLLAVMFKKESSS